MCLRSGSIFQFLFVVSVGDIYHCAGEGCITRDALLVNRQPDFFRDTICWHGCVEFISAAVQQKDAYRFDLKRSSMQVRICGRVCLKLCEAWIILVIPCNDSCKRRISCSSDCLSSSAGSTDWPCIIIFLLECFCFSSACPEEANMLYFLRRNQRILAGKETSLAQNDKGISRLRHPAENLRYTFSASKMMPRQFRLSLCRREMFRSFSKHTVR